MSDCPEIDALQGALAPEVAAHVAACDACQAVVELVQQRETAGGCAWFEDLLAVGDALDPNDALALESHLGECVSCRAIASMIPPTARAADLPIVSMANYAFDREVARGGMGRIVAAEDLRIGRSVAVKELLDHSIATAARFEREARITARLQHPGIVPIYEIGAWPDGTPFYTMRMVEGRTLAAAIAAADNRLSLLPAVIAAAEAIAFAHAHGVIHRDLKPSNIMVGAFGETVVIDWGLAKRLDEVDHLDAGPYRGAAPAGLTQVGEVMGTAAYMPPEQANAEPVDQRADVYALGAILFHLLAGAAPYVGATSIEIVAKVRSAPPAPLPATAPRDLASIVAKAMARAPAQRYEDAGELAAELARFQTGRAVEAHAYSRGERARRWLRRYRLPATVAVALLAAGAIGLVGVLRERDVAERNASAAEELAISLLEEQGRQELLAGHPQRALAYFDAVLQRGHDSPELRFMLSRALPTIEGHRQRYACGAPVTEVSAADGMIAATCGDTVRAWDPATQAPLFSLPLPHAQRVDVLGGTAVAIGDEVVAIVGGTVRGHLGADAKRARVVADGRRAVVLYADGTAKSWDATTGALLARFGAPTQAEVKLAASRDGSVVALGADGEVALYDGVTGTRIATVHHGAGLKDLDIAFDGRTVIACGVDGYATVWRPSGSFKIAGHRDAIRMCPISPDGSRTLLTSLEMRSEIWDLRSAKEVAVISAYAAEAAFSLDGKTIATNLWGINLIDAGTGAALVRYDLTSVNELAFTADLVVTRDGTSVNAWTTRTAQRFSFVPPDGEITLDANADGSRMISQRADGTLALYDSIAGKRIDTPPLRWASYRDEVLRRPQMFSGDGTRLAAWNGRDAVLLLDARTGATVASTPANVLATTSLDAHGERVLIADGVAPRIWTPTGVIALPGQHASGLSADGTRVLVWTDPHAISVWDIDAQRTTATLSADGNVHVWGYDRAMRRVVLSERTGVNDGGVYAVFDLASGRRLSEIAGGYGASFSADGTRAALQVKDGFALWRLADAELTVHPIQGAGPVTLDDDLMVIAASDYAKVASMRDGRELWRFDRYLTTHTTSPVDNALPERRASNGDYLTFEGHLAAWRFEVDRRDAATLHALIVEHVAWVERDGRLVKAGGGLVGRVLRRGAPVADANVTATFVDERTGAHRLIHTTRSRADGSYELADLPHGIYEVSAGGANQAFDVAAGGKTTAALEAP